jgi:hypothetical protein
MQQEKYAPMAVVEPRLEPLARPGVVGRKNLVKVLASTKKIKARSRKGWRTRAQKNPWR